MCLLQLMIKLSLWSSSSPWGTPLQSRLVNKSESILLLLGILLILLQVRLALLVTGFSRFNAQAQLSLKIPAICLRVRKHGRSRAKYGQCVPISTTRCLSQDQRNLTQTQLLPLLDTATWFRLIITEPMSNRSQQLLQLRLMKLLLSTMEPPNYWLPLILHKHYGMPLKTIFSSAQPLMTGSTRHILSLKSRSKWMEF